MKTYEVTNKLIPNKLVKGGRVYKIKWVREAYHIPKYQVIVDEHSRIIKVMLLNSFHPNALEKDDSIKGIKPSRTVPEKVEFCIPKYFVGSKFGKDVTYDIIEKMLMTWNLNDCYYKPLLHHFNCDPPYMG